MFRRAAHGLTIVFLGVHSACALGPGVGSNEAAHATPDADVFEAVVVALQDSSDWDAVLKFDPRPVRIRNDIRYPDPADYFDSVSEIAGRTAVLASLDLDSVAAFPLRKDCNPLLTIPARKVTIGCPERGETEFAFDRVRPGNVENEWIVRIIAVGYAPQGRSATISDFTVTKNRRDYTVTDIRVLVYID